ncbi:MAG: hypothetical protein WDW38_005693 [Sanguina aurantia]
MNFAPYPSQDLDIGSATSPCEPSPADLAAALRWPDELRPIPFPDLDIGSHLPLRTLTRRPGSSLAGLMNFGPYPSQTWTSTVPPPPANPHPPTWAALAGLMNFGPYPSQQLDIDTFAGLMNFTPYPSQQLDTNSATWPPCEPSPADLAAFAGLMNFAPYPSQQLDTDSATSPCEPSPADLAAFAGLMNFAPYPSQQLDIDSATSPCEPSLADLAAYAGLMNFAPTLPSSWTPTVPPPPSNSHPPDLAAFAGLMNFAPYPSQQLDTDSATSPCEPSPADLAAYAGLMNFAPYPSQDLDNATTTPDAFTSLSNAVNNDSPSSALVGTLSEQWALLALADQADLNSLGADLLCTLQLSVSKSTEVPLSSGGFEGMDLSWSGHLLNAAALPAETDSARSDTHGESDGAYYGRTAAEAPSGPAVDSYRELHFCSDSEPATEAADDVDDDDDDSAGDGGSSCHREVAAGVLFHKGMVDGGSERGVEGWGGSSAGVEVGGCVAMVMGGDELYARLDAVMLAMGSSSSGDAADEGGSVSGKCGASVFAGGGWECSLPKKRSSTGFKRACKGSAKVLKNSWKRFVQVLQRVVVSV